MDEFENELKAGFLDEAAQLLLESEQCFLALEASPQDRSILDKIFRLAHNLKGSAKAVGFETLGDFTHHFETYLLTLKSGKIAVSAGSVGLLLRCNDHIAMMIRELKQSFDAKFDHTQLLSELNGNEAAVPSFATTPLDAPITEEPESRWLASDETQEASETTLAAPAVAPVAPSTARAATATATDDSIRVSLARLDKLLDFVGEMAILQIVLREQSNTANLGMIRKTTHQLGKVTKEVQDLSMSLRMVPLKQTFQKMQRIVRDTSRALGKSVELRVSGEDTEVDKTVLENLSDPLVHLVRNAVDHAIEMPEIRKERGKFATGQIELNAYHQSGTLILEITDDGTGLDPEKLKANAIRKGILSANVALGDKEAYQLIFASGFSTKTDVTDISGRGVGMDVVRTNIHALQGDIQIETELGKGTRFKIVLPLTLAIIDGLVIRNGNERFIIPLAQVHESLQPAKRDLHHISGAGDVFSLRGEHLPLYQLHALLGRRTSLQPAEQIAIVVRTHAQPFAVLVDDIIGQHQVVIKKLGDEHRHLRGFSGSAILGDGLPSLILELPELIRGQRLQLGKAV